VPPGFASFALRGCSQRASLALRLQLREKLEPLLACGLLLKQVGSLFNS
jgi:hypothetical protein